MTLALALTLPQGLHLIKNNPVAKELFEREIGPLPVKAVPGCKKYEHTNDEKKARRPALSGLMRHAKAKMGAGGAGRVPTEDEEDDDDEDEEVRRLLHKRLFLHLEGRQGKTAQMSQLQSNMAGERAQNKAEKRKLVEEGEQERKRRQGVEQQLEKEREQQKEREMEHQRALDERDQKHQRFMSDSNSRMQLLHDDAVATLGKGIFDESMQAQKLARKLEREKRQALEQAEVEKRQLQKERHVLEELVKRQVLEEEEAERRMSELQTMLDDKEKERAQLKDENEDLEDVKKPLQAQNRVLQTKQDALFFVGMCAAAGRLAQLGPETLKELRDLPQWTTITRVGEVVRGFLQSSEVRLDDMQAGALGLIGKTRDDRQKLIGMIMAEKFIFTD